MASNLPLLFLAFKMQKFRLVKNLTCKKLDNLCYYLILKSYSAFLWA